MLVQSALAVYEEQSTEYSTEKLGPALEPNYVNVIFLTSLAIIYILL